MPEPKHARLVHLTTLKFEFPLNVVFTDKTLCWVVVSTTPNLILPSSSFAIFTHEGAKFFQCPHQGVWELLNHNSSDSITFQLHS